MTLKKCCQTCEEFFPCGYDGDMHTCDLCEVYCEDMDVLFCENYTADKDLLIDTEEEAL